MYYELPLKTPLRTATAFLQDGFFGGVADSAIHKHRFAEIHVLVSGCAVFRADGRKYEIRDGEILVIPPNVFHFCAEQAPDTCHTAFQVSGDWKDVSVFSVSRPFLTELWGEIQRIGVASDYAKLATYLSFLCGISETQRTLSAEVVKDYGFLIQEFFSVRYREDVRLCDLAEVLHLSERQCERLVSETMGRTFREELIHTRMVTAVYLAQNSDMTLNEIAQYVGYRSYVGFWKVFKDTENRRTDT